MLISGPRAASQFPSQTPRGIGRCFGGMMDCRQGDLSAWFTLGQGRLTGQATDEVRRRGPLMSIF